MAATTSDQGNRARQATFGLLLAGGILTGWLITHVSGVFFYQWGWHSIVTAPALVALNCWLFVGMFIVAHDCMHGSLVPFRPTWNRLIGQVCLGLYAGFEFDTLNRKHHLHHRHSGTKDDPDFDERPPHGFLNWYVRFFIEYFGWKQLAFLSIVSAVYLILLQVNYSNLLVFWAVPAILSSLQLFYFGTYLPHRPAAESFVDRHRTRSNEWSWLASLLTCFHFGYHHEHHLYPSLPWWRLPTARNAGDDAADVEAT
ncbi:MAG: fatty acid desaturase [Pseudomonadota bacterium]